MSNLLKLKRDPIWMKSGSLHTGAVTILLLGDDPVRQASVPASLLVAFSPLVRNILAADHLPPSFSNPAISFPSIPGEVLQCFGEMLITGTACMDMTRLCGVREIFKMLGIEDLISFQTGFVPHSSEDLVEHDILEKRKTEYCTDDHQIESVSEIVTQLKTEELNHENTHFEIEVELDKTSLLERQSDFDQERKGRRKKKEGSKSIKISCPQCGVKVVHNNLTRHISLIHDKKKTKCPQCNKTLGYTSLRDHIRIVHDKETAECQQCNKTFSYSHLRNHIRRVHDKETAQCPQCNKTLSPTHLRAHIRQVHDKEKAQCPQCNKTVSYKHLKNHIRKVHGKESALSMI